MALHCGSAPVELQQEMQLCAMDWKQVYPSSEDQLLIGAEKEEIIGRGDVIAQVLENRVYTCAL